MRLFALGPTVQPVKGLLPMARLRVDPWNGINRVEEQIPKIVEALRGMAPADRAMAIDGWLTGQSFKPGHKDAQGREFSSSSIDAIVRTFRGRVADMDYMVAPLRKLVRRLRPGMGVFGRDLRPRFIDVDDEDSITVWSYDCWPAIDAIYADAQARASLPVECRMLTAKQLLDRENWDAVYSFEAHARNIAKRSVRAALFQCGLADKRTVIASAFAIRAKTGRVVVDQNWHRQDQTFLPDGRTSSWQLYLGDGNTERGVQPSPEDLWRGVIGDLNRARACVGVPGDRFIPTFSLASQQHIAHTRAVREAERVLVMHLAGMGVDTAVLFNAHDHGSPAAWPDEEAFWGELARTSHVHPVPLSLPALRSDAAEINTGRVSTRREDFLRECTA